MPEACFGAYQLENGGWDTYAERRSEVKGGEGYNPGGAL